MTDITEHRLRGKAKNKKIQRSLFLVISRCLPDNAAVMSIADAPAVARGSSFSQTNKSTRVAAEGHWQLVAAAGEPFRLLFPIGATIGMFGVMMWPLYAWNLTGVYPGPLHPRWRGAVKNKLAQVPSPAFVG